MKILTLLLAGCWLSLLPQIALADEVAVGPPGYGGTGCPQGTMSIVLGADARSFSLMFDKYEVRAGGEGEGLPRVSCNIAIPVHVPAGQSVSLSAVHFTGRAHLAIGTQMSLRVESFFAGGSGPVIEQNFTGPFNFDFYSRAEPETGDAVWSECGADINLRINSSLRLTASLPSSVRITDGQLYELAARPC